MRAQEIIEATAHRILQENPDYVVRFRLLRDALRVAHDSEMFLRARRGMLESRWVLELNNEQRDDGGWGRFHSAMKTKGKIVDNRSCS